MKNNETDTSYLNRLRDGVATVADLERFQREHGDVNLTPERRDWVLNVAIERQRDEVERRGKQAR